MMPLTQPMSTPILTSHPPEDDQSGTSEEDDVNGEDGCKIRAAGKASTFRKMRH
jgi:hypothetical protein